MTSPYVDSRVQKYTPGNSNKNSGIGTVTFVTGIGFASSSDSNMHILQPKATPISGQGKMRDERKKQNQGFNW